MYKGRLEAFSDAVIAIIMTIMVLEMKIPNGASLEALRPMAPVFGSYVLSYVFLGIYWNNHHHMLQSAKHVNGATLWANSALLFWLSLIPFATNWMGETNFASVPVATYGVLLLCSSVAYFLLTRALSTANGPGSEVAQRLGADLKGKVSMVIYAIAVISALWFPAVAGALYALVTVMWLVPDRRFERPVQPPAQS